MGSPARRKKQLIQGLISSGCAYEIMAISTGRVPTLSTLFRHHRWAEALFLSWLLVHLHRKPIQVSTVVITERTR